MKKLKFTCETLSWNNLQHEIRIREREELLDLDSAVVVEALDQECLKLLNGEASGAPSLKLSAKTFVEELESAKTELRAVWSAVHLCDDLRVNHVLLARVILLLGRAYWLYMACVIPSTQKLWAWVRALMEIEYEVRVNLEARPPERVYEDDEEDVLAINAEEDLITQMEVDSPPKPPQTSQPQAGTSGTPSQLQGASKHPQRSMSRPKPPRAPEGSSRRPPQSSPRAREGSSRRPPPSNPRAREGPSRRPPESRPRQPPPAPKPAQSTMKRERCYRCWEFGHEHSDCPAPKRIKSYAKRRGRRGPPREGDFVTATGLERGKRGEMERSGKEKVD